MDRTEFVSRLLDRNGRWIEVADAKAGVAIVFATALLADAAPSSIVLAAKALNAAITSTGPLTVTVAVVMCVMVGFVSGTAALALINGMRTLLPRVDRAKTKGFVFFGDLAAADDSEVETHLVSASDKALVGVDRAS